MKLGRQHEGGPPHRRSGNGAGRRGARRASGNVYGLSGFGDLVATCYGGWSRNREFGQRIGEGRSVAELIANRKSVVEGYKTTEAFGEPVCRRENRRADPARRCTRFLVEAGNRPTRLPR